MRSIIYCAAMVLALMPLACEDDAEVVETNTTCAQVCDRYQECIDSDLDVENCTANCADRASEGENFAEQINSCNDCLQNRRCPSSVFNCTTECIGLVP